MFRFILSILILLAPTCAAAQPVKDVDMDCKGHLEDPDTQQETPVTASVLIKAGHVLSIINSYGMVAGPITETNERYLQFDIKESSFTVKKLEPTSGHIDRVAAFVSIFLGAAPRIAVFWLNCTVRKPQF